MIPPVSSAPPSERGVAVRLEMPRVAASPTGVRPNAAGSNNWVTTERTAPTGALRPAPTSRKSPVTSGATDVNNCASAENNSSGPRMNFSVAGSKICVSVLSGTKDDSEVLPPITIARPSDSAAATWLVCATGALSSMRIRLR